MISLGLVGVFAPAGQAAAAPPGCDKFGAALVNAGVLLTPAGPTLFNVVHMFANKFLYLARESRLGQPGTLSMRSKSSMRPTSAA